MLLKRIGFICLSLAFLAACKKSDNPGTEVPGPKPSRPDVVTPVGTPDGTAAATITIGAAGGQLFSKDGHLKLIVPPGAFTADQQVSIQQITNNCPGTHTKGYRITPEGVTFAKAVTLQFRIGTVDSMYYAPALATAAYQNAKGVWMAMPGAVVNAEARTVVVETKHFSDWTVLSGVMMTAVPGVISPGSKSRLIVYYAEDLLAPLVKEERPVPGFIEMPASQVKNWRVSNGPGTISPAGAKADYTAPAASKEEATEVAVVSADVETYEGNHVTLNAKILIAHGYIAFRVNNGTEIVHRGVVQRWKYPNAAADLYTSVYGNATASTATAPVWIEWNGQAGLWPLKGPLPDRTYIHFRFGGNHYDCQYLPQQGGNQLELSPGYVKITSVDDDGYYRGEFEVEKASISNTISERWKTVSIKGYFRVPKFVSPVDPIPF